MDTDVSRTPNDAPDATSSAGQEAPERWEIDGGRSRLSFALSHLVFQQIRGEFRRWGGSLFLNRRQPSLSSIRVWVDLASLETDSSERDAHLRSAEFFDVARHPRATFESTTVEIRDGVIMVDGRLELHGAVRDVQLTANPIAMPPDENAGRRETFSARATFNRQAFALHWNQDLDLGGVVVGDNVKLEAQIETIRFGDDARAARKQAAQDMQLMQARRPMSNEKRSAYFTRDDIMELLSDDEIAKVTTAESAASLGAGDDYIDLEQLDQGVRTAKEGTAVIPMGRVVSKKSIKEKTWNNILEQLKSRRIAPMHSGAHEGSGR